MPTSASGRGGLGRHYSWEVDYAAFLERVKSHSALAEIAEYGSVLENGKSYPLLRMSTAGRRTVVITAGFHGDEPAGPLTLAERFPEIAAYARARDVGLRVYPCLNPSGFEAGTRYNASGERPNNDLLRYEVGPGVWKGELRNGAAFIGFKVQPGGPKETKALAADLEARPPPDAALDIHQDNYLARAATYAYVFGDRRAYLPFVRASSAHIKVAVRCAVDEWHHTDACGLVWYHDGSITDYFWRRGVRWTAALETTTRARPAACHAVNLIWILGFVDLAALNVGVEISRKIEAG